MKRLQNIIGKKYSTNEGYEIEIIEYFDSNNCTIKFDDGFIRSNVKYDLIRKGKIKNRSHFSKMGNFFMGNGIYKSSIKNKLVNSYQVWDKMIKRCYDNGTHLRQPTYIECSIVEEWHNYQNFAKWYEDNYVEGFELDKDILVKGNKVYGPNTCCFVPKYINTLFTKSNTRRGEYPIGIWKYKNNKVRVGININNKTTHLGIFDTLEDAFLCYKLNKEKQIQETILSFKEILPEKVYNALYNYKVEITD